MTTETKGPTFLRKKNNFTKAPEMQTRIFPGRILRAVLFLVRLLYLMKAQTPNIAVNSSSQVSKSSGSPPNRRSSVTTLVNISGTHRTITTASTNSWRGTQISFPSLLEATRRAYLSPNILARALFKGTLTRIPSRTCPCLMLTYLRPWKEK